MRKAFCLFLLIFGILAFWFCQTKLFKKVHVTGRLVHYFTGEAVYGLRVQLGADNAYSAKNSSENEVTIGSATSTADGYFSIKGHASKRNRYHISVFENENGHETLSIFETVSLKENGTNDFQNFLVGSKTFYCKIKVSIAPSSNVSLVFDNTGYNFGPGSDQVFFDHQVYNFSQYQETGGVYYASYTIIKSGIRTYSAVGVPINGMDTVSTEVNF